VEDGSCGAGEADTRPSCPTLSTATAGSPDSVR
jgi:hypothetical protein